MFDKPLGRIAMKGGNKSLNEHLPTHNGVSGKREKWQNKKRANKIENNKKRKQKGMMAGYI